MFIKPIFEFILWNNCNNNCSFCFLKTSSTYYEHILNNEQKIKSIERVKEFLKSKEYQKGSHILLVGGELFDDSMTNEVEQSFITLIKQVNEMMINDEIEFLYINTNLMYENLNHIKNSLLNVLDQTMLSRVKFTTSYDEKGRYNSEYYRKLFLNNLQIINTEYKSKGLQICVNSILTDDLCTKILNETYKRTEFCKKYNVFVNFLPYIPYDKKLDVSREKLLKTLLKIYKDEPDFFKFYIDNFLLDQKRFVYEYMKTEDNLHYCTADIDKCGHYKSFKRFQDNEYCFLCDLQKLKRMIND